MPTFPSNTNSIPNNLGKPNPPITLRRDTGRTPGHRARHNLPRNPLRKAVRNPLHRNWHRGTHDPGRDTGHTTQHHPEPTPTSTNTPHHSTPEKRAGKAPGNGREGRGASLRGRGRGRRGYSRRPSLPLQPQKTNQGGQQVQDLIGIGHRPKNHQPKPFKCQRPPTTLFRRLLDRRHSHRLDPPHEPPTTTIRPRHALRTGNLQTPLKLLTSTKHLGYLH